MSRLPALALLTLALAACGTTPKKAAVAPPVAGTERPAPSAPSTSSAPAGAGAPRTSPYAAAQEDPNTRGHYVAGGLYRPGVADTVPDYIPDVGAIPEPEVVDEPRSRYGNRSPYAVLGRQYHVMDDHAGFVEQGLASYYGNKFHGRRTSNMEVYDMYAFTAAHKSLPLPSFALVTNLENGKSVVVRVNDRGPFHEGRVVDLSYAAAVKLGYRERGTARVEVRALQPGDPILAQRGGASSAAAGTVATAAVPATGIDQLVTTLDARPAPAAERRSGRSVRNPVAAAPVAAAAAPVSVAAAAPSSPMVAGPAPADVAASVASADAVRPAGERFDLFQNGRVMTADEFDAWMAQRQLRVATGQPTRIAPAAPVAPVAADAPVVSSAVAQAGPAPAPVASLASMPAGEHVTLQVASFADQRNAGQALALLQGANIAGARLQDADVGGRRIWRLRIGPVELARASEVEARIARLGMGTPQRVRE